MADLRFFVTQEGTLNKGGSGNDTIFTFTGTQSATTVKGVAGNDLISFTNQTTAITVRGSYSSIGLEKTAGAMQAIYSGAYVSAGGVFNGAYTAGNLAIATTNSADREVSAQIQTLQNTGVESLTQALIAGGEGNDSIYLGDQLTTFSNVSIGGGQGNDIIGTFNSGANTAGHLGVITGGQIRGGAGNDTVFVNTEGASATQLKVVGNAGNDSVMFSGETTEVNSGLIGGGAGNDDIAVIARSANKVTVNGGAGNDSINILFSAGIDGSLIAGDNSTSTGADTINLGLSFVSSTTVDGGAGADSIVLSGQTDGGSNFFDAGEGNDTVFFQAAGADTISGSTVVAGAGNDSILFNANSAGAFQSGLIKGGAGKDTITFAANQVMGSAGVVGASIKGGGGADSLTLNAIGSAGGSGTFVFSKFSESTLDSMDTLTFNTAAVSAGGTTFASAKVMVNVAPGLTTGVSGAGAVSTISASGGFVVFSGYSDNSITARVSAINAGYTTTGDFAVFTTNNTTRYLFVQGGATDLVARLSDEADLSAGLGTIVKSGNTLGFGS
jgi:hypothetical protein